MALTVAGFTVGRSTNFPYLGMHSYLVTCCTFTNRPWFSTETTVAPAAAHLLRLAREERFAVLAYCFLPDRLHALVEGMSDTSDLPKLVARWKRRTGEAHNRVTGEPLWQGGFHDRVLKRNEDRRALTRYLLTNPVRSGLVLDPMEYPFWGSGVWSRPELVSLVFDVG